MFSGTEVYIAPLIIAKIVPRELCICPRGGLLRPHEKVDPQLAQRIGVLLGAVGVYQPLAEFAGAGASVPLTGFGNTLAKGVKEAVQEDGFLGIFTGGLKASAGGITAAILSGLIASLIFKAKDKS